MARKYALIRETAADRVFNVFNISILSIILVAILYPLIYIFSASFSSAYAVIANRVWLWPVDVTFASYKAIFKHRLILTGYGNSFFYMFTGTIINLIVLMLGAYPLSRKDLPGRNIFTFIFVFTMFFSGGMIPSYLLVRNLGMLNTRWAMIVPGALSVYNMVVARTYFQKNIPAELLDASQMDGCTDWRFFLSIVLPLSTPIIAVMALFHAVGHWNSFFNGLLYLSDPNLYPLQLVLRDVLFLTQLPMQVLESMMDQEQIAELINLMELLKYAVIVVGSLPVLILYPFIQRYFVRGMLIGSLKG